MVNCLHWAENAATMTGELYIEGSFLVLDCLGAPNRQRKSVDSEREVAFSQMMVGIKRAVRRR